MWTWLKREKPAPTEPPAAGVAGAAAARLVADTRPHSTSGQTAEDRALAHLVAQGLTLVQRNYRVARGPSQRGGEIDLVMLERDGTLVFVEVRYRANPAQGGAAASVTPAKQRRVVLAAQHFLSTLRTLPPCRFDVVAIDGDALAWLPAAFSL
jgi:putative endonuclease